MSRPWTAAVSVVIPAMLLVTMASAVRAEDVVPVGARVRVLAPELDEAGLIGSVVGIDDDSFTVVPRRGKPRRLLRADVQRLEVSRGRGQRGKAALVGLGVGFLGGFVLGAATNSDGCEPDENTFCFFGTDPLFSDGESGAMMGVLLGGVGALVGAAVGPGEKWEDVSARRVRVSLSPSRKGAGVSIAFTF